MGIKVCLKIFCNCVGFCCSVLIIYYCIIYLKDIEKYIILLYNYDN